MGEWLLAIALFGSTIGDVENTYYLINHKGYREANPIVASYINHGRVPTYAIQFGLDAGVLLYAHKNKAKKSAWVPVVIVTASHGVAIGISLK